MSSHVAIIPTIQYKEYNTNWESDLANIGSDVASLWVNNIGETNSPSRIGYDTAPLHDYRPHISISESTPEDALEKARVEVASSGMFYEENSTYDAVIVVHDADYEPVGKAYVGGVKSPRVDNLAAGTSFGVGITFRGGDTRETVLHELAHTYGARHRDAGTDIPILRGTVMSNPGVENCDGDETLSSSWAINNCTVDSIEGYADRNESAFE